MDYEQKYKNALERVRELLSRCIDHRDRITKVYRVEDIESIFPELIESEDERIRKALISILKSDFEEDTTIFGISVGKIVGWLERQGDRPNNVYDKELSEILGRVIRRYTNNPNIPYVEREKVSKEIIPYVESLEGQGSQILDNSAKTCKDEQKSTDKVEPKFKVGEWLRYRAAEPFLVEEITEQGYINGNSCLLFEWENEIHLWTIQDAKDGDVLVSKSGDKIFSYRGSLDLKGRPCAYYGIYKVYDEIRFTPCAIGNYFTYEEVYPATKEQRDLLFQKMKEAGYEWDAEKKELKKIPNELEEREIVYIEHGKYYYCIKDYYAGGNKRASKGDVVQALNGMNMMALGVRANEYFIPVNNIEQKPAEWSEEDMKMIGTLVAIFEVNYPNGFYKVNPIGTTDMQGVHSSEIIKWLKSLKDRAQHQLKQEWSKEDEIGLDDALWCCKQAASIAKNENEMGNAWYAENWLKTLKDRYTWKPSEEQIEALESATENCAYSEYQDCLRELIGQLKNLKEE